MPVCHQRALRQVFDGVLSILLNIELIYVEQVERWIERDPRLVTGITVKIAKRNLR